MKMEISNSPKHRKVCASYLNYSEDLKKIQHLRFESRLLDNGAPLSLEERLAIALENPNFREWIGKQVFETTEIMENMEQV